MCTKQCTFFQVQENAVNGVNTGMAVVSVASTIALFTPFAVFGVIGLIGTGVGGAAAAVGDGIANNVKANRIKDILESKKDLVERAEEKMKSLQHLIEKVAETGKIPITSAETICFGIANVAKAGAGARVALQGDKVARLFGLFRVWRAGQLAPGGVAAIRGLAGAGSKLLGGLGAVIGIWVAIDGWVYGNRTKNATIENKKSLENSRGGLLQFIDILEGKTK